MTECPFSGYNEQTWADHVLKYVIKLLCSRGASGTLYLQSAIVGVMLCRGLYLSKLPLVCGVEIWVLRGGTL